MKEDHSHQQSKVIAIISYLVVLSALFAASTAIELPENTGPHWPMAVFGWLAFGFAFYYLTSLIEVRPTHENRGVWRELSLRIAISCVIAVSALVANLKIIEDYYQESVFIYALLFLLATIPGYTFIFWHASKAGEAIMLLRESDDKRFNQMPEGVGPEKPGKSSSGAGQPKR